MVSPLKQKPNQLPGQSLNERRQDLIEEKILTPFITLYFLILFCIWEWVRYFFSVSPHPGSLTIITGIVGIYLFLVIRKNLEKSRRFVQGLDGERFVGMLLEAELRQCGCSILHDFQNKKGNIDHVLICTKGIFTIETKTWSKNSGADKIDFDGVNIIGDGFYTREPIRQAHAQGTELTRILEARMGRSFTVRPVIVFPGHFIDKQGTRLLFEKEGIWLLNPKVLADFVKNEPETLSLKEVDAVVSSLRNYTNSA